MRSSLSCKSACKINELISRRSNPYSSPASLCARCASLAPGVDNRLPEDTRPRRLDETGAFCILPANLFARSGYADDRAAVGPAGEAQQAPDGGANADGGGDVCGGDGGGDGRQGRPLPYGVCYLSNSKKYLREDR